MYFWRIERLKEELHRAPLGQREAFAYVLATMLLYSSLIGAPALWNADAEPATVWDWAAYAATVTIVGGGTYAAYRANGGRAGADFAARYFALGWVLGVRLLVLLFLPALLLLLAGVLWFELLEPEREMSAAALGGTAALLGVAFEAVFYWRLVHHLKQVAEPGPAEADIPSRAS